MDNFLFEHTRINGDVCKLKIFSDSKVLKYNQVMSLFIESWNFRQFFIKGLVNSPIKPFFFETPAVNYTTFYLIDFEFVLIKANALENVKVDLTSFSNQFSSSKSVVVFHNIGKDAKLVVPCPIHGLDLSHYAHFSSFVEYGCPDQVEQLLVETAFAMMEEIKLQSDKLVWLSTSGLGVSWIHIRLDSKPKYYNFSPYKFE